MYFKPKTNFAKLSVEELDQAVENTVTKMTADPLFADLAEEVGELGEELINYRAAVADATRGGKHATTVRDEVRAQLMNKLQLLALQVQRIANGDRAIILAAGFNHNKQPQPKGLCPRATGLQVVNGPLGSCRVTLKVKSERTARTCRFGYRLAGGDERWVDVDSHSFSRVLEGLQQFAEYEFRCTYIGSNPDVLNYSETVTATVI